MFDKVLGRTDPVEFCLREHFSKLGVPDDLVVFQADKDAVSFRYLGPSTLRDTVRLIRGSSQVCLIWFHCKTSSKEPQPQINFCRKECYATMPEALDALTPHLNPMIRARKTFNFSNATAVKADSPLAAWDLYRSHLATSDFIRAHSLLTGAALTHYGKRRALYGAAKLVALFPDAIGFEKEDSYSYFVNLQGELVPYCGENFAMGKLLFPNQNAKQVIRVLRIGQHWRIAYMPWNLGKHYIGKKIKRRARPT